MGVDHYDPDEWIRQKGVGSSDGFKLININDSSGYSAIKVGD